MVRQQLMHTLETALF